MGSQLYYGRAMLTAEERKRKTVPIGLDFQLHHQALSVKQLDHLAKGGK